MSLLAAAAATLALFQATCASCHGAGGVGTHLAPPLIGVPEVEARFMLDTGRMPAAVPYVESPQLPTKLTPAQIDGLARYVADLSARPDTAMPVVRPGDATHGRALFAENCQQCHGVGGEGGAIGAGTYAVAPSILHATGMEVAEAMRAGPGAMPRFGPEVLNARDVDDVATYVGRLQRDPRDPGGFALGSVGPVAEGLVAWLFGIGLLIGLARALGSGIDKTS